MFQLRPEWWTGVGQVQSQEEPRQTKPGNTKQPRLLLLTSMFFPPTHACPLCSGLLLLPGPFHLVVSKVSQMYYVHNRGLDFFMCTCFLPGIFGFSKWLHSSPVAQRKTWGFLLTLHFPLLPKSAPMARLVNSITKIFKNPNLLHYHQSGSNHPLLLPGRLQ